MSVVTLSSRDLARLPDDELLQIYYLDREPLAREQLVKRFLPFARKLALRYVHSREPLDDLVQVACVGLLNAIDRFEPGRGKKFTSFAAPTIGPWRSAATPSGYRRSSVAPPPWTSSRRRSSARSSR
jgi:Sigma-70 region 2